MTIQIVQDALRIGLFGPIMIFALNLVGLWLLNQPAARFLSEGWWSAWFPAYLVAFGLIMIGTGCRQFFGNKRE